MWKVCKTCKKRTEVWMGVKTCGCEKLQKVPEGNGKNRSVGGGSSKNCHPPKKAKKVN